MKKFGVTFIFVLWLSSCTAQGIRFNFTGLNFGHNASFYMGIGYENNIKERLALSLESNIGFSLGDQIYIIDYSENGNSYTADYSFITSHWFDVSYQSKYFLSDNDDGAFYIASGLAVRNYIYKVEESIEQTNLYYYDSEFNKYSKNVILFPLSMKMGYRGPLDFFFVDVSLGATYMPGASTAKLGIPNFDEHHTEAFLSNFFIGFCFSAGFGWE